ncbi:hypothetical protein SAMN06269185_1636 [Natronoarchaeum philippinense]|uniref:Uncharacterized protein n=1 Tax=Natronoarchaeum philippinense TaxID=558529 RepID=A0A285NS46_NATPI|nr:hypothetical protein [Natronoarchaeum philippinense]SNZ12344.1 hypothetical protein SAMN06269185_1636 [Natronoarchaeum philippinense]
MADGFESVDEALEALKDGETTASKVREQYGHVDGIERSISVALAKRNQDMTQEVFEDSFSAEFSLDREWPTLTEAREMNWPPNWDAADRLTSVVYGLRQPRETEWIAERADVDVGRAEEVLEGFDWVSSLNDGERWYPCSIEERDEYRDKRWSKR